MFKSYRKLLLALGLVAAIAVLTGCADVFEDENTNGTSTAATGEPYVVGVLLPLSGEASAYGLPSQRVLQIAASDINAAGGIGGRPIKLEFDDGACDSDPANKAMNNLVSVKKVQVVIGGFCSSETLAAAPIAEQNKVVLFSPGSSNPKITEAGDYVFRNYPSDLAQGQALADYANKKRYKNVGILVEEQPYTEGIADAFTTTFEKLGGKTAVEKFAKDASDFRTQITKLQAASVDVFFVDMQAPTKAGIIVKQLQEAGVKGPFILNDVAIDARKEVLEPFKDFVEGSVGALVPYDASHPDFVKLEAAYKTLAAGENLPYRSYMAPVYDSLWIAKEAVEKVGYDGTKIKDYLYTVKGRKGLAGTLSFDSNGDPSADYRHALKVVKAGELTNYSE